jgi:hypothetical protein
MNISILTTVKLTTAMLQRVLCLMLVLATGHAFADEQMDKARANYKDITLKRCNAEIAVSKELAGLNKEQYCQCSTERFVDVLTDLELKQMLLQQNADGVQQKQEEAAAYCMANNDNLTQLFDQIFYTSCVDAGKADQNPKVNMEEYCGCTSKKLSSNLSQDDMRDFMKIGSNPDALVNTNVSSKMMNYATECLNQMVK